MTLSSHSLLWYHSCYAGVTQITPWWGFYWYQKSLIAMVRNYSCTSPAEFPVLRDFSAQKPCSLPFSLQVYLTASVFASRPVATGNLWSSQNRFSDGCRRMPIDFNRFVHSIPSLFLTRLDKTEPNQTKTNQCFVFPMVAMLWRASLTAEKEWGLY